MNRQQRKRVVKELARERRLSELVEFARGDKRVIGVLCGLLFEQDDLLRWRVVEGLGAVAGEAATADIAPVRELLRRLEWLMNDESGGAGWHSPEAMAAIVLSVPQLLDTFGVIIGAYLDDEPLKRGAHWAVAAISKVRPDLFSDKIDQLRESLTSADPWIRGCAVVALTSVAPESAAEMVNPLCDDSGTLELYQRATGKLRTTTVGELAKAATSDAREIDTGVEVW